MGQVLHGCARTTAAVRRAIQSSQESLIALAERDDINPKTVHKWRKRSFVSDGAMGPEPRSTTMSAKQEAMIVAFRKHTLLPLDDCHYALQATIPQLTRSSLHRCFQRHGISRLPDLDSQRPAKKKFKVYPIGYFHIDLTEVRTAEVELYLFVAIDRTSKFAFARLVEQATRRETADFLQELIEKIPYRIHTVLTDNCTPFTTPGNIRSAAADLKLAWQSGEHFRAHFFEVACARDDIDHRLTKPKPSLDERLGRTHEPHDQRGHRAHLSLRWSRAVTGASRRFPQCLHFAKRLKSLAGLTSYQFICSRWQKEPRAF